MGSRIQRELRRLALSVPAVAFAGAAVAQCTPDTVSIRGDWGQARFAVEIADDPAERARGLMHVPQMPLMSGMLFIYDAPHAASFWMRNTLIPLDMIFVDQKGEIRTIHSMARPHDETPIFGGTDIQYVLEINGGLAERLGLRVGDVLRHPSLGDDAAWPCEAN